MQTVFVSGRTQSTMQSVARQLQLPVVTFLVMVAASLLAVQVRLQLPIGLQLFANYRPHPFEWFVIMASAALLIHLIGQSAAPHSPLIARFTGYTHPYREYVLALATACIGGLLLLPDLSQLQIVYFALFGLVLGFLLIALPFRVYVGQPGNSVLRDLAKLWANRQLMFIWLNFNLSARYRQRVLGALWIILVPVSTAFVLAIAFSQFMRVQLDVPFVAYYLAALVPYTLFSNSVMVSTMSVLSKLGLVTQVYFPREILVLVALGEGIVDFCFAFLAMLFINLLVGIAPNIYFLLLPIPFIILLTMAVGVMLFVSSVSVLVRDIPQLMSVLFQLLFFMTPIIYPITQIPVEYRFLFVINPVAAVVQAFRDIIVYARPPDLVSLHYPLVFAVVALVLGYATFKSIEPEMADVL